MTYDDINLIIGVLEDRLVSLKGKNGTEHLQNRLTSVLRQLRMCNVDIAKIPTLTQPA